jgi:hypothetical protein
MILLDTNVVSEPLKPQPSTTVVDWLDMQAAQTLYISTITIAELSYGIASLPEGRRQQRLSAAVNDILGLFETRILVFDVKASKLYGQLAAHARAAGQGFPTPDGYIAAIAAAHGFDVATRDGSAFRAAGITTINPWNLASSDS